MVGCIPVDRNRLRVLLASSSVAALLIGGGAPQALAGACVNVTGPGGFTNSTTVTCISVTNSAISGNIVNSAAGTINAGTTPGTRTGIIINNSTISGAVINSGSINAPNGTGIDAFNNAVITGGITNTGTITGRYGIGAITYTGIFGNSAGGGITNIGSITANSIGIYAMKGATFAGGITNLGTISAGTAGILVGATTSSHASVSSFGGNVSNNGTIGAYLGMLVGATSSASGKVSLFSGNVSNSGMITAHTGIFVGKTGSSGRIGVSTFVGNVVNSGTIVATSVGVQVQGVSSFIGNVANSGTINARAGLVVDNVATFTGNLSNGNGGTISASRTGMVVSGLISFTGNVSNAGTITANTAGILVEDLSVFSGNVSNSGTINGGLAGIQVGCDCGIPTFTGNVVNSGTITGFGFGIVIGNYTGPVGGVTSFTGNVINSGTIATGADAILVAAVSTFSGQIINSSGGGTISTSQTGIAITAVRTFTGSISNGGSITSTGFGDGIKVGITTGGIANVHTFIGNIVNSGSITVATGVGIGVTVRTFIGNVSNSGTISIQNTGIGIAVEVPTFIGNVSNSGTITGGVEGIFICGCVNFSGGGITNTGSISAVTGILVGSSSPVSIFNSGTVVGTGGTAIDLIGATGGNTLTLGPGFSIVGNVLGAGADTFQLGGTGSGGFDLSTVGTQYTGFTTFNVVSGTWTVSNVDGQTQAWNVNGGTLAGTGTLPGVNVNSGGTLEPGTIGAPGTFMTITGNLAFQSGAIYLVNIGPATASRANVGGAVTLAGGVQGYLAPGSYSTKTTYDILDPTSISGTFTGFTSLNAPGFTGTLTYTANDVLLNLTASLGNGGGLNTNQQNVATTINNYFNNGGTLPANFFPIFGLSGGSLGTALNQLDGEVAADGEKGAFQLMNEFLSLMLDPFVDGRSGGSSAAASGFAPERQANFPPDITLAYAGVLKAPPAAATFDRRWTAWGSSYGGYDKTNGNATVGSNTVTARTYGFAAGMDYHLSPDTAVGLALAGGGTNWGLAQGLGSGRSDAFQAGIYGTTHSGPAYVAAALAFTNHWMTTNRIAFAGDQLDARFNAQSYGARVETGYRFTPSFSSPPSGGGLGWRFGATPYAALQTQWFHTPNYSETDLTGGGFGLSYNAMTATDTRSELGARFDDRATVNDMPLILRARAAWAHDWVTNPTATAVFQALPGANFIVNGATPPKNSALASAGAELHLTAKWSLTAKFDGEFAAGSQTYAGTGTLRYTW